MTLLRSPKREVYRLYDEAEYLAAEGHDAPSQLADGGSRTQRPRRIARAATALAAAAGAGGVIALHGQLTAGGSGRSLAAVLAAGTSTVVSSQRTRARAWSQPYASRAPRTDARSAGLVTRRASGTHGRAAASRRSSVPRGGASVAAASHGPAAAPPMRPESPPSAAGVSLPPATEPTRAVTPAAYATTVAAPAPASAGRPEFGFEH